MNQYAMCGKYKSDILPVNKRVSQFNIFINDISQLGMKNVLIADDAVSLCKISKFS